MRDVLLIAHLMLIAIGTGMSFGNYVNLRHAAAETGERAAALAALRSTIGRIGDVVIVLIWASGLALMWNWVAGASPVFSGWFYAKLGFVVVLTLSHALARRTSAAMARTKDASLRDRVELCVAGVWLSALAAIVLSVIAFEM